MSSNNPIEDGQVTRSLTNRAHHENLCLRFVGGSRLASTLTRRMEAIACLMDNKTTLGCPVWSPKTAVLERVRWFVESDWHVAIARYWCYASRHCWEVLLILLLKATTTSNLILVISNISLSSSSSTPMMHPMNLRPEISMKTFIVNLMRTSI